MYCKVLRNMSAVRSNEKDDIDLIKNNYLENTDKNIAAMRIFVSQFLTKEFFSYRDDNDRLLLIVVEHFDMRFCV